MVDMLERIKEAKALVDGERDNLLKAIMAIAAHGGISIIPRDDNLTTKPVIILPQRMYDRLVEISESGEGQNDG